MPKKKSGNTNSRKPYPRSSRRRLRAWRNGVIWFGRFLAGLVLAVTFLIGTLYLAARFFITPEMLRGRISTALEATFHRPVKIDHVTLVLHQGLKVSGLEVAESEAFPGKKFISSEFLLVTFNPFSLLRGSLELGKVLLVRPEIILRRRADGIWNIQDVLTGEAGKKSGGRFSLPPLSAAKTIAIESGSLSVRDIPRKLNLNFSEFGFEAEGFNLEEEFGVRMNFVNLSKIGKKTLRANFELDGSLDLAGFRPQGAKITARTLNVTLDGKTLHASGEIRDLSAPEIDLKFKLPPLTAADLGRYKPTPSWVDFPASTWEARFRPILSSTATAELGGEAEFSTTPASIIAYHVPHLSMSAGGLRLGAWGRYRFSDQNIFATVRLAGADLSRIPVLYPPWKENAPAGRATGTISFQGPWTKPAFKRAALQLRGLALTFWKGKRITDADLNFRSREGFKDYDLRVLKGSWIAYANALSDLDIKLDVKHRDMAVQKLKLIWNGSRIDLNGCIKNVRRPTEVYVDGEVETVRVDEAYAAIENVLRLRRAEKGLPSVGEKGWAQILKDGIPPRFPDMVGRLTWRKAHSPNFETDNFRLVWDLHDIAQGLDDLNGHFRMSFGPGRMKDIPQMRKGHPLVDLLLIPYVEMHRLAAGGILNLEKIFPTTMDFTKAYGEFNANRGIVDVIIAHFDSSEFVSYSDGKVDFPREKTNLHVLLRLPKVSKNLAAKLLDGKGRPSIDVNLVDNLNSPTINFNFRSIKGDDIENALASGLTRVTPFPPLEENLSCGRTP